jgi:hypothetical protein
MLSDTVAEREKKGEKVDWFHIVHYYIKLLLKYIDTSVPQTSIISTLANTFMLGCEPEDEALHIFPGSPKGQCHPHAG